MTAIEMAPELEVAPQWRPDDFGLGQFKNSYAIAPTETWEQGAWRWANHVAAAESNGKRDAFARRFYGMISAGLFMPGGRICYGSGRPKAQLLNCFVIPVGDSREEWGEMLKNSLIISGTGGGVGIPFTAIRPEGSEVKGTGGFATGPVSLMRMDDGLGAELVAGGNRRMAKMWALGIRHPDVQKFLDCKLQDGQLSNGNISVILDFDAKAFVADVQRGETVNYRFAGRDLDDGFRADELWARLVDNAWNNGEPGVLNGQLANDESNIHYHKPLISTNPCGEIWLEAYGCCCLGALVLPRFVRDGQVDWALLEETIRLAVRFLDDVLTVNVYPLEKIRENCEEVRRIGLGVMGLHTMLLELGMKYSSRQARKFVDRLFAFIKHTAYDTSISLAIEKGPFPAYDPAMLESGFMERMKPAIARKVKEYGIRNCALLTIAPTGTTGMVQGVSTGIEPYMAPVYWRRRNGLPDQLVVEPVYEQFPELIEGAADLHPRDHFEMQKVVQQHIDNAVSKTINLPNDFPQEELSALWLEFLPHIKGSTFYRWGSREGEPYSPVLASNIQQTLDATDPSRISRRGDVTAQSAMDCVDGVCEVPPARHDL